MFLNDCVAACYTFFSCIFLDLPLTFFWSQKKQEKKHTPSKAVSSLSTTNSQGIYQCYDTSFLRLWQDIF
jgi:hypothetical protein